MVAAGIDMGSQSTKVVLLDGGRILAAVTLKMGESKGVGIADKCVITGGIGKNVGVVAKIGEKLSGLTVHVPPEPQIAGAIRAALFALDRARKRQHRRVTESDKAMEGHHASH
jgi:activator of 2-hydroxyglutaryl-CoA dehydratase